MQRSANDAPAAFRIEGARGLQGQRIDRQHGAESRPGLIEPGNALEIGRDERSGAQSLFETHPECRQPQLERIEIGGAMAVFGAGHLGLQCECARQGNASQRNEVPALHGACPGA